MGFGPVYLSLLQMLLVVLLLISFKIFIFLIQAVEEAEEAQKATEILPGHVQFLLCARLALELPLPELRTAGFAMRVVPRLEGPFWEQDPGHFLHIMHSFGVLSCIHPSIFLSELAVSLSLSLSLLVCQL